MATHKLPLANLCEGRLHCYDCRHSEPFRESIAAVFDVTSSQYVCPYGLTPESVAPPLPTPTAQTARLGDALAALLRRCGLRKRPGCGCGARQSWLNEHQSTVLLIVGIAAFVAFSGVLAAWLA